MAEDSESNENKDVKIKEVRGAIDAKGNEDYLVVCIGAFGAWQAKVCILVCVARFMVMWNWMFIIFLTYDSEFICTSFNATIPENVTESTCYDGCTKYEFAEGLFTTSFVAEFELICERAWMANMVQSMMMFGFLFGVFLFGWISDRYGRRIALMLSSFINVVLMVASPFSPNYWLYASLRFFIGVASGGVLVVAIVVILEVVGPQYREIAAACAKLPDGIGEASLCAFAYFSPTWRVYALSIGIVSILILASLALVPETPRWLMTNGQLDAMRKLMVYAAKW
ncbi:hypothetical protein MSG28_003086 [Choristoneura fumiferana]|uniref:Uncharacterized protein n=1 Tax=Choristoneura fumiferana TaxID=7141 RepID=A0ACC0JKR9_CHOFU|nr:hypothetical protein MSG28_003086 [Choristoneura fumiferana]